MSKLFDVQYWFDLWPGAPNLLFWRTLVIAAAALVVMSIVAMILRKKTKDTFDKKFYSKFSTWALTIAPVFWLLAFFRSENAYFVSMRFFYLLWFIIALVWLILILKFRFIDIPRKKKVREEHQAYQQYLPRRK